MADITKTYTLESFIESGRMSSVLSYDKLSLKEKDSNSNPFTTYNLINDYYNELKISSVILSLSDTDLSKYKYRPKLLSYTLYGTTELFYLILLLNDMSSVKQFDKNKIKVIRPENISNILSYIYGAEQANIINNRSKLGLPINI